LVGSVVDSGALVLDAVAVGDGVPGALAVTVGASGAVAVAVRSSGELHAANREQMMRASSADEQTFVDRRAVKAYFGITSSPRR
jgi:hypothetical protein